MIHSKHVFEILVPLGHLDMDDSTDLWSLHYVFIDIINKKMTNSSTFATTILYLLQVTKVLTTFGSLAVSKSSNWNHLRCRNSASFVGGAKHTSYFCTWTKSKSSLSHRTNYRSKRSCPIFKNPVTN